jgi:hypothetical protein
MIEVEIGKLQLNITKLKIDGLDAINSKIISPDNLGADPLGSDYHPEPNFFVQELQ